MLKLTKTGIGLLTRQYRSVLKKCWAINVGLFALSMVILPRDASAENIPNYYKKSDTYSRNEIDDIQSLNIPYVIVAGWRRSTEAFCANVGQLMLAYSASWARLRRVLLKVRQILLGAH